ERNLLYGLLALEDGLIDQDQLLEAFRSWALDKGRPLADHLAELRYLNEEQHALIERFVAQRLGEPGGQAGRGLVSILASLLMRESLAGIEPDLDGPLVRPELGSTWDQPGEPGRMVGPPTSDGQRYRILGPYARGGLGAVFEALDTELNRKVALKQIRDEYADDPHSRWRFLLEAEINGGLGHPGLVPVYSPVAPAL